jgi:hypothetical protein
MRVGRRGPLPPCPALGNRQATASRPPAAVHSYLQRQAEAIAHLPLGEIDDSLRVLLELRD